MTKLNDLKKTKKDMKKKKKSKKGKEKEKIMILSKLLNINRLKKI